MWNRKVSRVYEVIVLVESIIDALSLIQNGVENVQPLLCFTSSRRSLNF
jgi:hypothetical protein